MSTLAITRMALIPLILTPIGCKPVSTEFQPGTTDGIADVNHPAIPDAATILPADDPQIVVTTKGETAKPTTAPGTGSAIPAYNSQQPSVVTESSKSQAPAGVPTNTGAGSQVPVSKGLISTFNLTNAKGWGTTAQKRIEVKVLVDGNKNVITPGSVLQEQVTATPTSDGVFSTTQGPITAAFSALKICNQAQTAVFLHSGGNVFAHGNSAIAAGKCSQFLVRNGNALRDGSTYDHIAGSDPENHIFFKITKIGPDGKVVP